MIAFHLILFMAAVAGGQPLPCGPRVALVPGTAPTAAQVARLASDGRPFRILRPGDMATMDVREDRLNIHLDRDGRIVRLTCG